MDAQKRREARRRRILQNAEQRLEKVLETHKANREGESDLGLPATENNDEQQHGSDRQADSKQLETKHNLALHKENGAELVEPSHTTTTTLIEERVTCSGEKTERETKPSSFVYKHDNEFKPHNNRRTSWKVLKAFIIAMLATSLVLLYHFELIETVISIKRTSFIVYFGLLEVILLKYFKPELDDENSFTVKLLLLAISLCGVHKKILEFISKIQAVISHVLDDLTVFVFSLVIVNIFVVNNAELSTLI